MAYKQYIKGATFKQSCCREKSPDREQAWFNQKAFMAFHLKPSANTVTSKGFGEGLLFSYFQSFKVNTDLLRMKLILTAHKN